MTTADDVDVMAAKHAGRQFHRDSVFGRRGLDGDDAFEFLEDFAKRFGVDFDGYNWTRFHHDEAELIVPKFWTRALRRIGLSRRPDPDRLFIPVSVAHLAAVADAGRWIDPNETTS